MPYFPAGTLVTMADGGKKLVEQVQVGDCVVTHSGIPRRVAALLRCSYTGELVTVCVPGELPAIVAAADQRFAVQQGNRLCWSAAEELVPGDHLLLSPPERLTAAGDAILSAPVRELTLSGACDLPMYGLSVEKDHSFVVGGLVVYDCSKECAHGC